MNLIDGLFKRDRFTGISDEMEKMQKTTNRTGVNTRIAHTGITTVISDFYTAIVYSKRLAGHAMMRGSSLTAILSI